MDILKDYEFQKIFLNKELSKTTLENYTLTTKDFCKAIGKSYTEIVCELKEQQYDKIEDNKIIRYDAEQGLTKEYITQYVIYLKNKKNKNSTINVKMVQLRTLLKDSGIIMPRWKRLTEDNDKKNILLKKDLKYIMDISNIHQIALFTFIASTGIRISDVLNFKIEDYIIATQKYHNCVTLNDFLQNATDDMMGFFEFTPSKTRKSGLVCKVCNSKESNKYILMSLKERIRLSNNQLTETDYLFGSREKQYKGRFTRQGINSIFSLKEKKLKEKKVKEIQLQYMNKEITQKEYKEKLEKLPKFTPHSLRHYFISHLRASNINMQVSLLMEAHSSPNKMDKHYVGENEELFSEENIREEYKKLLKSVTITTSIDIDEYEHLIETKKLYDNQLKKNEKLENKINELCKIYEKIDKNSIIHKLIL